MMLVNFHGVDDVEKKNSLDTKFHDIICYVIATEGLVSCESHVRGWSDKSTLINYKL